MRHLASYRLFDRMAANLGAFSKRLQGGFLHFFIGLHGASRRFIRSHMSPFFALVDPP
jgi:hypothetical protein